MKSVAVALACAAGALLPMTARAQCRGRPTDPGGYAGYVYAPAETKSFATDNFRVHFATSGQHAPNQASTRGDGVPDTVALAGTIAETALAKYVELGFQKPLSDAACASNGGDAKTDIYLVAFAGADGTTATESCNGATCASFFLVESTFQGRGYASADEGFRTVVAHELFHGVQNTYDSEMDRFWAEGTAQWAMKTVYPDLQDFERQLPAFFSQPSRSLDAAPTGVTAGYLYGSAVWPLYLTLHHGATTVRDILEAEGGGAKTLAATDAVLAKKGASIADTFPLFAAWNVATKSYAGASGYPDAAKYPGVKTSPLQDGTTGITSGLASYAYTVSLSSRTQISLDTDGARNQGVAVPLVAGKADLANAKKLPAALDAGDAIVVVAGVTSKKTDAPFTVHLGEPPPEDQPVTDVVGTPPDDGGCALHRYHAPDAPRAPLALGAILALTVVARRRASPSGQR